jgi:hypothetical protein
VNTYRKNAVGVGVFYIIGTVAGILSVVASNSLLGASDYLTKISAHETQMITGAFFVLLMGLALVLVPLLAFPVLKKHNETLAVGYVVFRGALEFMTYFATALSWLLLVPVSQEYVKGADASSFRALGKLLVEAGNNAATLGFLIFPLGALMLYYVFYRANLIPRWISGWGIIAVGLYLLAAALDLFDVIEVENSAFTLMVMPMALQEMVMAIWLIVKGFNPSAVASE